MPRCCSPPVDEFSPCYASVLAYGKGDGLREAVGALESSLIVSCFTAWCPRCRGNYLLTTGLDGFPCPSAHYTHHLKLLAFLRDEGVFSRGE